MQYLKSKIKVQVLKAYMPFLFILVVIGSCENRTEPKKEIPTKYPKQLSVKEIFELQDVESQEAIRRLENSGYKYELDLNKEGTVCSVYAFDLREDKTASQRICVGHRDGKKYLAIHTYDNTGSSFHNFLKEECEKIGVKRKTKYKSTSNVPCDEWKVRLKTLNFCEGVEHGHAIYLVEVLE